MVENLSRYVPSPCFARDETVSDESSTVLSAGQEFERKSDVPPHHDDTSSSFCGPLPNNQPQLSFEIRPTSSIDAKWQVTHEEANRLLLKCYLDREFFDFIDVDSFGSDSVFIGAALSAVRHGGLLYLTCTDGFSSGGHRPHNSLASYGAFINPMPYGNELGLRMLIGGVVKEAALRKMIVSPVFSVYSSHGPVFRVLLRVSSGKLSKIKDYRFIYYCTKCGDSDAVDWEHLGRTICPCSQEVSNSLKMSGPLWTGPLHSAKDIRDMIALARKWGWIQDLVPEQSVSRSIIGRKTKIKREKLCELLHLMLEESHPDLSFGYLHLDEVAKRGKIPTPRRDVLIQLLQNEGYIATRSQIASSAVKTNCPMSRCVALAQTVVPT